MFTWNIEITDTKVPITAYGSCNTAFSNCTKLVRIPMLIFAGATSVTNMFQNCTNLVELNCEGCLTNDLDLQWSKKLSQASIMSVLNAAHEGGDYFNDESKYPTVRLSLAAVNKAYETSEGANDGSDSLWWQSDVNNYHCQIELI